MTIFIDVLLNTQQKLFTLQEWSLILFYRGIYNSLFVDESTIYAYNLIQLYFYSVSVQLFLYIDMRVIS